MILSILICSLRERTAMLQGLLASLERQIANAGLTGEVEVLTEIDAGEMSIGEKRNILVERSCGEYVCFIDDDDRVSDNYVKLLTDACRVGKDCVGIVGEIFWHKKWTRFTTSIANRVHRAQPDCFDRVPNHLNPIKRSIVVRFKFPHKSHGEDAEFWQRMEKAKAIQTEEFVSSCVYHYTPSGVVHRPNRAAPRGRIRNHV